MSMTWLANADKATAWAHHTWSDFASLPDKARFLAVLPVHGFADHGLGLPLDAEEVLGSELLRRAASTSTPRLRVLPPLRFGLAPLPSTFFGIDPETAHDLVREIAACVQAAGFRKLVFFNTSPWNEEFIDAASRDTRVALGLQTFVINLGGLDLDLHPTSADRTRAQAAASHLLGRAPEAATASADVLDPDFRPGRWRQPPPVTPDPSLDTASIVTEASARLGRLLAEIDAKAPLGSPLPSSPSSPSPAPAAVSTPSHTVPDVAPPVWPRYRPRYLPALTRREWDALPDKENTLVILPTGAIEQHGYHLPVGVDSILGQAWLDAALPKLPADARVVVAPPLTYGKSNEHVGFPGTVYISAKTLRRLLLAQAQQLHALGFRSIGLLNTHGGNSAVLVYTVRELQAALGLRIGLIGQGYKPTLSDQEREYGFHAGEWETSLMLAATDGLVRRERAVVEYPARLDDPGELRPENAPAIFSWISSDISRSGTMGDATLASEEKGRRWLDEASTALAQRIADLARSR